MNDNCGNGGGSIGGDSDGSEGKLCRDFMRNVCKRGKNCRFVHPENIKIRTDPIFCHDFQQERCFRSNCKFIHCNREEEEHYKLTGELPVGVNDPEGRIAKKGGPGQQQRLKPRAPPNRPSGYTNGSNNGDYEEDVQTNYDIPLCKDFLKGICDRPSGGCKFRHIRTSSVSAPGYSRTVRERGPLPVSNYVAVGGRRKAVRDPYDEGPTIKRYHLDEYNGHEVYEDYEVEDGGYHSPRPPPPPPRVPNYATYSTAGSYGTVVHRNGYQAECLPYYQTSSHSDAMKSLEDENFMLKRRIEELKSSNEFLLNQNAQLRLNNSLSAGTSVQPLAVSAVSVSGAMPSQPSIIGITSSSLSATQPLPTISISTIPTVSCITPVSVSQSLQSQPQSQTQIYLPAPN